MGTLVLLPGMDGTGKLFQPFREALGDRLASSVVSYPTDQCFSYEELEKRVVAALPIGTYVLMAESFSGPVAISLASRRPLGLRGVVLCNSFVTGPAPRGLQWFARAFQLGASPRFLRSLLMSSDCPASLVATVSEAIRSVRLEVLRQRLREVSRVDMSLALRACEVPILYLMGAGDRLLGKRGLEQITKVKPGVKTVVIDGPHFLLQCRPCEVVQAVEPILQEWFARNPPQPADHKTGL